jgi:hypothetical protein
VIIRCCLASGIRQVDFDEEVCPFFLDHFQQAPSNFEIGGITGDKRQAEVNLFDSSGREVVAEEVVHQDAVVGSNDAWQSCSGDMDTGVDATEEITRGWEPAWLKMGKRETGGSFGE